MYLASSKMVALKEIKTKRDEQYEVAVDVEKLLKQVQVENIKYKSDRLNIDEKQFVTLCRMGRSALLGQPSLLRLNGPIFVATGTVGHYKELMHIISRCGHPAMYNYLFLGDYTGRGDKNIECLVYLICCKLKFMDNFFLLRGCLDSIAMTRSYNFYDQCLDRFSPKAWTQACQFLCSLPFAAVVQNQIFCCHGGLSPSLKIVEEINKIPRPLETPESGLACDLIWSDLSYKTDSLIWSSSERGFGHTFHEKAVDQFLKQNRLSMMVRGHEVVYEGFQVNKERTIGTVCSLVDYGGLFSNSAAVFVLNHQYQAYFKVIKQREHFPMENSSMDNPSSQINKKILEKQKERRRLEKEKQEELQREEERLKKIRESTPELMVKLEQIKEQDEEIHQKESLPALDEDEEKMKVLMGLGNLEILSVENRHIWDQDYETDSDGQKL